MDTGVAASGVTMKEHGLETALPGGKSGYFNFYWLRDNCSTSFDSVTRERTFEICRVASEPRPASVAISGGALEIVWMEDGHVSRYPLEWLSQHADARRRPDPANLQRSAWYGDHYPDIARFSQRRLLGDRRETAGWIEALLVEGVAIVDDMPDNDEALTEIARLIGQVRPTFFGEYFDVRTHINPVNLAYTAKALELHTDSPAEDMPPGVQFLHCRRNSVEGGMSLFLDGLAVAEDLRKESPDDFKLLSETLIPFYCEHDTFDMRARQRVIELDEQGEVSGVTISQHMADVFDLPQTFLDRFYPAFCRFGRMLQSDKYLMRFRLNAGECIVFDNHRIAHGREAYSATSGERHLRGCYSDRGELRSAYRTLTTEGRFK
jgi:gamma-butyrobetaine dioxygenase